MRYYMYSQRYSISGIAKINDAICNVGELYIDNYGEPAIFPFRGYISKHVAFKSSKTYVWETWCCNREIDQANIFQYLPWFPATRPELDCGFINKFSSIPEDRRYIKYFTGTYKSSSLANNSGEMTGYFLSHWVLEKFRGHIYKVFRPYRKEDGNTFSNLKGKPFRCLGTCAAHQLGRAFAFKSEGRMLEAQ